jgi:hypothetical protein
MATMDVYGFAHEDLLAARRAIEGALSICLEEAEENTYPGGCYFRWYVPDGPCVQLRRNSGPYQRWQGDPSNPWHPAYGVLVFVHGPARESVTKCLQQDVPGLSFLETKETM